MKKLTTIFLSLIFLLTISSASFGNGLSLNSIGSRALGMGGAFVGLAGDGSAIYWNPSGLAFQGSSLSLAYTGINPMATYQMELAGVDAESVSQNHSAPNFFGNYSMGNLSIGLGVFVPAGLGVEWNGDDLKNLSGGQSFTWKSRIGVIDIAPAVAYKVSEKFSLGVTLNIYYAFFDMERPEAAGPAFTQYIEESTGTGIGFTVGAMYKFNEMVQAGLTFRSETAVTMDGTATNPAVAAMQLPTESSFERDVAWPMWIAGGIALHPACNLTLTLDAQYSNWEELDKLVATYEDWGGMEGEFELLWENATQIRFGAEYMASPSVALRGGYYYDPAPSPVETLNILFPSSTNHVVTGGVSYYTGDLTLDFGAEYLFGEERESELTAAMPGIHQMDIFAFSVNLGYAL